MWNKLGHTLRWLGEKGANSASWLGHKVGGSLAAISPVASLFNLVIGAGVASAGMVLKGVGALGDAGKPLLARTPRPSGGPSMGSAVTPPLSARPTKKCGAGWVIR